MKTLKRIVLVIGVTMAGTAGLNAQDNNNTGTPGRKVHLGVKGGLNYSNVYDEQGEDFVADGKYGWAGGAFLSVPIGNFLGIQPEFMFSQRGFQGTGSVFGFKYGLTRTSTFIDVPVLVTLSPVPFVTIVAGPQFSYLARQKDEFTSSIGQFEIEREFENDNIRKNIMCFVGGVDVNLANLVVGARAGFDFQDNQGDGTSTTPRYKNTWVQGTIGFRF